MPTPHHLKNLAVPGNRYTLKEAAAQGLMLSLACAHCRKPPVLFLASDLIRVLPPSLDCFQPPPFACSTCGTDRYIAVTLRPQEASRWARSRFVGSLAFERYRSGGTRCSETARHRSDRTQPAHPPTRDARD